LVTAKEFILTPITQKVFFFLQTVDELSYQMFRSIIQQLVVQCDTYRNIHLQAAQEIAQLKNENVTLKKKSIILNVRWKK
jgi:hypothetical protein